MAGTVDERSLSEALSGIFLSRYSLSESIRDGHEHLLHDEEPGDIASYGAGFRMTSRGIPEHGDESCPMEYLSPRGTHTIARKPVPAKLDGQNTLRDSDDLTNVMETSLAHTSSPAAAVKLWNPIWLQRTVLIGFITIFASMLLALGLLYHFSERDHGLSTQISRNRYSWTYGPTALLILVHGLWWQVDYWCRVLVPWQVLKGKTSTADRSLLVDYISPNPLVSTWAAWKNRHWVVLAGSGGLALLKLIAIFSTGLLTIEPTSMTNRNFPLIATTRFTGQAFNDSRTDTAFYPPRPVVMYSGNLDKGLPYQNGTLDAVAYESVGPADDPPQNATITAGVLAFFPELDCEAADLSIILPPHNVSTPEDLSDDFYNLTFTIPGCSFSWNSFTGALCDPHWQICPEKHIASFWSQSISGPPVSGVCNDSLGDVRLIFIVMDIRYNQTLPLGGLNANNDGAERWSTSIARTAGLVCKPEYSLKKSLVSVNLASAGTKRGTNVTAIAGHSGFKFPNFSILNLTSIFYSSIGNSPSLFGETLAYSSNHITGPDLMYQLMLIANGRTTLEAFLDPWVLSKSANAVFKGISSQIAQEYLLVSSNDTITGQVEYIENRLHLRVLSVWLMSFGFGLMAILGLSILLLRPYDSVPRDPTPIGAIGALVASSKVFNAMLRNTGHSPPSALQKMLSGNQYRTIISEGGERKPGFVIEPRQTYESGVQPSSHPVQSHGTWWRPMSTRMPFLILAAFLPISLIVSLEIVQRFSDRNEGIIDISPQSDVQALTNYIPAAIMLTVAGLYSSIDSTTRILAPYSALARGNVTARRSILSHFVGKTAIFAFVDSVREHHPGILFSAVAGVLSSLLTIIVSGLYIKDNVPLGHGVYLQQVDQFNLTWNNSLASDNSAASTVNLIEQANLSYPQFTFDELTFPVVRLPQDNESVNTLLSHAPNLPLKVQLPALRAALKCTQVPYQNINVSALIECETHTQSGCASSYQVSISVRAPLPHNCLRGGPGGNLSYIEMYTFFPHLNGSEWTYGGQLQDLHVGPYKSYYSSASELDTGMPDNPPGCPSLAFTFGVYRVNETSPLNTTVLICNQLVEEIQTNATLLTPDLTIDTTNPPSPDESTAKGVESGKESSVFREYRIQQNLQSELSALNGDSDPNGYNIDMFYQPVVYGPQAVPSPKDLIGQDNVDYLFNATQHFYRIYMAQAINSNMRQKIAAPSSSPPNASDYLPHIIGTITDPTRLRLKQDNASKLTLQILLGVILACGLAAHFFAGNMRKLLMHNPCSIAGVASLLAGSEMVERRVTPEGAEWMSDKDIRQKGVFDGWVFSLGWWGNEGKEKRRFGVDVGRAESR